MIKKKYSGDASSENFSVGRIFTMSRAPRPVKRPMFIGRARAAARPKMFQGTVLTNRGVDEDLRSGLERRFGRRSSTALPPIRMSDRVGPTILRAWWGERPREPSPHLR